jgi:hypothetical protein
MAHVAERDAQLGALASVRPHICKGLWKQPIKFLSLWPMPNFRTAAKHAYSVSCPCPFEGHMQSAVGNAHVHASSSLAFCKMRHEGARLRKLRLCTDFL